jgi:hypothetical protein
VSNHNNHLHKQHLAASPRRRSLDKRRSLESPKGTDAARTRDASALLRLRMRVDDQISRHALASGSSVRKNWQRFGYLQTGC